MSSMAKKIQRKNLQTSNRANYQQSKLSVIIGKVLVYGCWCSSNRIVLHILNMNSGILWKHMELEKTFMPCRKKSLKFIFLIDFLRLGWNSTWNQGLGLPTAGFGLSVGVKIQSRSLNMPSKNLSHMGGDALFPLRYVRVCTADDFTCGILWRVQTHTA